jgi:hypothetical protein
MYEDVDETMLRRRNGELVSLRESATPLPLGRVDPLLDSRSGSVGPS